VRPSVLLPFALLLVFPRRLTANEPIVISVESAGGCLSAERLAKLVDEHLENESIPNELSVTARLGPSAGFSLYHHDVEIAERRFGELPEDCDSVHSTFGVAIAIAVEHALTVETSPQPSSQPPGEDSPTASSSRANSPSRPRPDKGKATSREEEGAGAPPAAFPNTDPPRQNQQVILSAGGGALFEVLPRIAGAWNFQVKLLTPTWFSVSGTFLYSWRVHVPFEVGRAQGRVLGGQLHACFEPHSGLWSPAVCLGLSGGALHAQGQGIWEARTGNSAWLALGTKASVRRFLFNRAGAEVSGEFFFNILRTGVQDRSSGGQIESAAPVGAALLLGAFVVLG
jgi:hypothetical protein